MDQTHIGDTGPSGSGGPAAEPIPQQLIDQLTQLLGVLQKAHGVLPGYEELAAQQCIEERDSQQKREGVQLQQEQRDKWAQELLVTSLTQQLAAYAAALEQLHSICQQQELRVGVIQSHALGLQQQLGQKHKRIQELEKGSLDKESRIGELEGRLHKYRRLCSYVTANCEVCSVSSYAIHSQQACLHPVAKAWRSIHALTLT